MKTLIKATLVSLLFFLASCSKNAHTQTPIEEYVSIPDGKTAISGFLVSGKEMKPVTGMVVRLGDVVWNHDKTDGNFIIDGSHSPSILSDEKGYFLLNDLEVKDYVIVLGNLDENPIVITLKEENKKARILSPSANQLYSIGTINLDDY